ncbi:MAG TPA: M56 family metallopeptidase [Gemmatimonadaceae bacterium]|nr:M56 family metallopeptidase [Gemmatimonadaceae bacterium]
MTPLIPALIAKLTLILAFGLIIAATLRSFSPSLRHLILFATLASCLVLPFAMFMSPKWNVPLLPGSLSTTVSSPTRQAFDPRASASGSALTAKVLDAGTAQSRSSADHPLATLQLLPVLWALGFMFVMGWLAIGRIRLNRIAASSWPLDSSDWSRVLYQERSCAGVTKPILLCSSSVVSTPLTWGSRAPIILLPEDALDWPEQHRRIVLRHELAHIARGDSFTQLVAGFACALYWFHPLAWFAERRLRTECERACDDSVVSLGTPAAEYAAHLLEVARSARAFGAPGFLSVAMARPSQLEGRLLAVLDGSRRRVSLSRGARPVAGVLSTLILIPLAAFRPVPKVDGLVRDTIVSRVDTTFQLSVPARSAGTLTLNLKTGGAVIIKGWDKPEVSVRVSLGGRDWRETEVSLRPSGGGARLESAYRVRSNSQSSAHHFEVSVPHNYNVRISSAGGSLSIESVDGTFTGQTGGGEINIQRANGEVDIQTGGGEVHVSNSRLNGSVSTGGGIVRIEGVTGNLTGNSGSGPVIYKGSNGSGSGIGKGSGSRSITTSRSATGTTTSISNWGSGLGSGFGASGIRMSSAGGAISLPAAPDGARVTTGGGPIRIGPSGGEVYASTGGGQIDIGPATGSVEAHTGAGDVTVELKGADSHSLDVTSGKGQVVLVLPRDLDATLELETAYTDNLGHKTRIVSDWPLQTTETDNWDDREGTPRRYVRARQTVGRGGAVIRVRTVNGSIVLTRKG